LEVFEVFQDQRSEVARRVQRRTVDIDRVSPTSQTAELPSGLHLLVEPLAPEFNNATDAHDLPIVVVPASASYLYLEAGDGGRFPSVIRLVDGEPHLAHALRFEPVRAARRPALLMVTPTGVGRLRINGRPAPRVALLRAGDQLHLDGSMALHVVLKRKLEVVKPPSELVGRPCGYCRVPFTEETTIVVCECGVPLHFEGPPKPEGERLECAQLAACPECQTELPCEAGELELPEL
jgi:hypothetical protein